MALFVVCFVCGSGQIYIICLHKLYQCYFTLESQYINKTYVWDVVYWYL